MKPLGILLIVLGALSFVYGGISYTRRDKVVDLGPIEASVDKKERLPLPPIIGGIALVAGAFILMSNRKSA